MSLLRIADVQERTDDHAEPYMSIESVNDALEDTPYAIHSVPQSGGYSYVLTMEADDE